LKQQLAELAIQINMDTHKGHQTEAEDRRLKQLAQNKEIEVFLHATSLFVKYMHFIQATKQREEALQVEEATKNQAGARYERNIARIAQGVANIKGSLQRKSRRGINMERVCALGYPVCRT